MSKVKPPHPKGYKYNGTHWMQDPKNRDKVVALAKKRAQSRKQNGFKALAHAAVKSVKKSPVSKALTLVINGWRVTLDGNTVRIDK